MNKEEAWKFFAAGCSFVASFEGYYPQGDKYKKDFEDMWNDKIFDEYNSDKDYDEIWTKYGKWNKFE